MAFVPPAELFQTCLSPTDSSTPVRFQVALERAAEADGLHVAGCEGFDVDEYVELGHCTRELKANPVPVPVSKWGGPDDDRVLTGYSPAAWDVSWRGHALHVVDARWTIGYREFERSWVIAESEELAKEFLLDVARVTNDPRDAILVFHGSCWQRSRELYASTQQASFDDLILAPALKDRIRSDFRRFLEARAAYEEVGLAWRRGALLVGPPGNGKTHCVRALVKELGIPSLYVQSVKTRYETEEANLKRVFERARQLRPCILVLEDLDALINAENRSFFLNQLDGFEKNVGLIVLATTNHPDRIDPAILDRPSRFDRKYHFHLPELSERHAYLSSWQTKLGAKTEWASALTGELAASSEGFSFAYLKELVTATLQRFVGREGPFDVLARDELTTLKAQMKTAAIHPVPQQPTDVADTDD
jgi:AAA+ superfamily predicted ATPase